MIGIFYSAIVIVAIAIHCIINKNVLFFNKKEVNVLKNIQCYRKFLWGILFYYITDAFWGILDELKLVSILRVDTFVYYIAMSVAVVFWCDYIVFYLQQNNSFGKFLRYFGRIFVLFEIGALILNFHNQCFFWFDEQGNYHAEIVRYIALYVQITMLFLTTVQTIFVALKTKGIERRRHLSICLFSFSMIIAIVAQVFYPLLPIYSIGYLVGTCFLHIYVEEDEKDEYIADIKKQMSIVSSMASVYFCSYYIDMKTRIFTEIDNKISENNSFIGKSGDTAETIKKMCEYLILPEFMKEVQEFTNLDTLDERIGDKNYITMQFKSIHVGWAEGYFIVCDREKNGKLKHAIWAIRTINDEKRKEEKLLYNSYIDELTGLYNRKMFSEDTTENLHKFLKDNFVYIAMDVNGLKSVNDTKGHSAGDELIKGAAACMKTTMGKFGRIYRTGGDEFIALLNADKNQLEKIKEDFENETSSFKGKFIDSISVSCGYFEWNENPNLSITEIEKIADKNMYLAKKMFYTKNGIDRRAQQQNAFNALCAVYTKILLINLTENKYIIISMNEEEQSEEKGFSDGIFEWLENFGKSNQVHPEDKDLYFSKTSKEYLTGYFRQNKASLSFSYRRQTNGEFRHSEMEIIPSENYSDDNQNLYLYVKTIEK